MATPEFKVTVFLKSGSHHTNHEPVSEATLILLKEIIRDGRGVMQVATNKKTVLLFSGDEVSYLKAVMI